MATRNTNKINHFWKALAHDPALLRRTWTAVKEVMRPGALSLAVKEMLYVAVSATNQCDYCLASHSAAAVKAGMTPEMFGELMSVVGLANQTNRLASAYRVEIDEAFRSPEGLPKLPDPRGVVARYFQAMVENRPEIYDEIVDPEMVGFDGSEPGTFATLKQYPALLHSAASDVKVTPLQMTIDGEWVTAVCLLSATHTGNFMGIPATGRRYESRGMTLFRIVQGKILEIHAHWDVGAVLRQLGTPSPLRLPMEG